MDVDQDPRAADGAPVHAADRVLIRPEGTDLPGIWGAVDDVRREPQPGTHGRERRAGLWRVGYRVIVPEQDGTPSEQYGIAHLDDLGHDEAGSITGMRCTHRSAARIVSAVDEGAEGSPLDESCR